MKKVESRSKHQAQAGGQDSPRAARTPAPPSPSPAPARAPRSQTAAAPAARPRSASATPSRAASQRMAMSERIQKVRSQNAQAKRKKGAKEVALQLYADAKRFAADLIRGKANLSKSAKDFPINRGIFGRMKRYGPAKVYRLKGYTTVGRVKKRRSRDNLKRHRNRLILMVIIAIFLIILYIYLNPLPKLRQFMFDIGYR